MRGTLFGHLLMVVILVSATACGGGDSTDDDRMQSADCNARIRFGGVTYVADNAAIATPAGPTSPAGKADVLGCTKDGWKVTGQTTALKMRGVRVKTAIAVKRDVPGVYVAENTNADDWPETIRRGTP